MNAALFAHLATKHVASFVEQTPVNTNWIDGLDRVTVLPEITAQTNRALFTSSVASSIECALLHLTINFMSPSVRGTLSIVAKL